METHSNMNTTDYTFPVFVFGGYYHDDVELSVNIPLSDDDVATIQTLVSQYDGPLDESADLMPILEAGAPELQLRFFEAIYPHVFFELFDLDSVDLSLTPADSGRQWNFERDIDYMLATYGDALDVSDAFVCRIPDQFIQ